METEGIDRTLRPLPDPDIILRDAADFVLDSPLGRKALSADGLPDFAVFLRDLVQAIHRLASSCHLPEFTDHGIPHICSVVDRISQWTCTSQNGSTVQILDVLSSEEALILLLGTLWHDIGMLSQKSEDLDDDNPLRREKGRMDISEWVRKTHVSRLRKLVRRLFRDARDHSHLLDLPQAELAFQIAEAHDKWLRESGFADLSNRSIGLAAIIAITDLLDEDWNRCDSATLISHREGSVVNKAHWIRHTLSQERILIQGGEILVVMARPRGTDSRMAPFFKALRNHYRLVLLYNQALSAIDVHPLSLHFDPAEGCPDREARTLGDWYKIPGFGTQGALLFHLLSTFFPEALLDERRLLPEDEQRLRALDLEEIDLTSFYKIRGANETRSTYEREFKALSE